MRRRASVSDAVNLRRCWSGLGPRNIRNFYQAKESPCRLLTHKKIRDSLTDAAGGSVLEPEA